MKLLKNFWTKLKSIKHIEIILAVVIGLIVCAVYFAGVVKPKTDKTSDNPTKEYTSAEEYVDMLENKMNNVLSKIDGAGNVSVIITLECGFVYEYAKDSETKTTVSGNNQTSIKTETIILVSNQPVIEKEIFPTIKGVVVVAQGAKDFSVKMNILSAVETILEVDRQNITVLF